MFDLEAVLVYAANALVNDLVLKVQDDLGIEMKGCKRQRNRDGAELTAILELLQLSHRAMEQIGVVNHERALHSVGDGVQPWRDCDRNAISA